MTERAILTELRNASTQTDIGREIFDKLLEEAKQPRTPADFRGGDLDRRFAEKQFRQPR